MRSHTYLGNLTADGTIGPFEVTGEKALFSYAGTWGSGTLVISYSPDNGTTYIQLDSVTADGYTAFEYLPSGTLCKAVLSGATGPDLKLWFAS